MLVPDEIHVQFGLSRVIFIFHEFLKDDRHEAVEDRDNEARQEGTEQPQKFIAFHQRILQQLKTNPNKLVNQTII